MPTIRYPYKGPCPAACALHLACFALIVMAISVNASAQEQSQPPQTPSQEESKPPDASVELERWNLYYQATSIGDVSRDVSCALHRPAQPCRIIPSAMSRSQPLCSSACGSNKTRIFVFNPEIAGGKGFSGVDGIANPPNGEIPRVASADAQALHRAAVHPARFRIRLRKGARRERRESARRRPSADALFDLCRPLHRHRFFRQQRLHARSAHAVHGLGRDVQRRLGLSGRYARLHLGNRAGVPHAELGVPLRHRGRTEGRQWSAVRPAAVPRPRPDRRGIERRYSIRKHAGAVRLLGYANRADAGTYAEAHAPRRGQQATPDVVATRRPGTLKYGTGVNLDQEITPDIGVFSRLGWNDGKTESFAFTAIDRLASGGVSVKGTRWQRKDDTVATSLTAGGISGVHASYLARGGLDFLIGDGRLNYAPGIRLGELLQRAVVSRILRQLRCAARHEPGLQSRSRAGLDLQHPSAHGVRAEASTSKMMPVELWNKKPKCMAPRQ